MNQNVSKKQLTIFFAVAFALPYLLGILMGVGYLKEIDLTLFPTAQMYYPAAGVMLAALLTGKGNDLIPKRFFIGFLLLSATLLFMAAASVFAPGISWFWPSQIVMLGGTVVAWILLLTEKRYKREAYGLKSKNWKKTTLITLLFLVLYMGRAFISYAIGGEIKTFIYIFKNPQSYFLLLNIAISYFLGFTAFLGEEYGWRFYLQPIMQKRFGALKGVIVLGVLWGIWHLPINFFYYSSPANGLMSVLAQIITCITLGVFFAYGYMKTNNIWLPVILHFLNNNLILLISGNASAEVLQNQQVQWSDILFLLVVNGILFFGFGAAKQFRSKEYLLPTMEERVEQVKQAEEMN